MTQKYITLGSNDLERSYRYYDPVMEALGAKVLAEYEGFTKCYQFDDGFCVWVGRPQNGESAAPGNGHTAGFSVADTDTVDAAYKAALANGGTDEGAPGPRPLYGPDFYGAYARDPDGNKMSFVTHTAG
ncbi:MAG: VOC family protein [Pseudomonadota bacterium]